MRDHPDVKTSVRQVDPSTPIAPRRRRLSRSEAQALTRRRILEAAAEVFGEKGFRAALLTDVADRAGYTIGAVYSNFASKDELFHAMMRERLRIAEEGLAAALGGEKPSPVSSRGSIDDQIEQELDLMAASEDAVPPRWWRLLYEYRAYAATDPAAAAELSNMDRRCREIIAGHIERFAAGVGLVLPVPAIEAAELNMAIVDGLRAAHAEGRIRMTSGEGLRLVVGALLAAATRVEPS